MTPPKTRGIKRGGKRFMRHPKDGMPYRLDVTKKSREETIFYRDQSSTCGSMAAQLVGGSWSAHKFDKRCQ